LKRSITCAAAGLAAALVLAAPAGAADWTAGAPSSGDPFFPDQMGNGGYDVQHYSLELDYSPATQVLDGSAEIRLVATQNLEQFNLDLRDWFGVSRVTVDGVPAAYFQEDEQELVISPRPRLRTGTTHTVEVDYRGVPQTVVDPDDSFEGWVKNPDGAFVVNEPQGSPGWFPCNDDPNDKATYDFNILVPAGNVAIGNGRLISSVTKGRKTHWRWREDSPMSTYLTTATNGDFDLTIDTGPNGLPIYNAIDSKGDSAATDGFSAMQKTTAAQRFAAQPQIISVLTDLWGPYPFSSAGAVIDRGHVGYALESQTKPMYDGVPGLSTVVHELAHQWFGDSVTLSVWPDIWLNEGFARFSEWMYNERTGGPTAQQQFEAPGNYGLAATDARWQIPPRAIPGPANLFSPSFVMYNRGAMTLQALRVKIGDATFFPMMRAWYAENRNGNVTTEDFIALAEREHGQQLDDFFDVWLYTPGKPTSW
jgi:aminopeptidase N